MPCNPGAGCTSADRGNNNPEAGGEPPVNVHVVGSRNLTFTGCTFSHLGGVYGQFVCSTNY